MENKIKELGKLLVEYSLDVEEGERVLINTQSVESKPLIKELIKYIYARKGIPFLRIQDTELNCLLLDKTNKQRMIELKKQAEQDNENFDAFIQIRFTENEYEDKLIDAKIRKDLCFHLLEPNDIRINKRKWVLLNYPSLVDAYKANMSTDDFKKFAYNAMTYDYSKMKKDLEPLKKLMEKTDKVRILGPNTDLVFSIKGIPVIPCCGEKNIPDGEIYTAPVKNSVNGRITYNTKSPYSGNIYNNISLLFKDGKIIECSCDNDQEMLEQIFNSDEGSRYVGEFAIGVNKEILNPIGDILYDEKITGSIHFTPGRCYEDADNGNVSVIHWDLVLIQREEYGGGEIYFDDVLIRKDGLFVLEELKHLN